MPVPAVGVVGHHHLRSLGAQDPDHRPNRLIEVGAGEGRRVLGGRDPTVAPATATAQPVLPRGAQRGKCLSQLCFPVQTQPVGIDFAQPGKIGRDDLAQLATGTSHQDNSGALPRVAGHRCAGHGRLIVGMGMHQQQPTVIHPTTHPFPAAADGPASTRLGVIVHPDGRRGTTPPPPDASSSNRRASSATARQASPSHLSHLSHRGSVCIRFGRAAGGNLGRKLPNAAPLCTAAAVPWECTECDGMSIPVAAKSIDALAARPSARRDNGWVIRCGNLRVTADGCTSSRCVYQPNRDDGRCL